MPTPRDEMRIVARRLEPLNVPFVFVGGAVMCLLVDDPELTQFRRTKDVDVVVGVVTHGQFTRFEEQLRENGFGHDTSEGAPICRWIVEGCKVDIMPAEPANLGMNTRWFPEALQLGVLKELGEGCLARVVSPTMFLATKLEAFKDRGKGDYFGSHDLEDLVTLLDGCASIVEEVNRAEPNVRTFISRGFGKLVRHPDFGDALLGHQPEKLRVQLVRKRFIAIAALVPS